MFFDARSFIAAPRGRGGGNAIRKEPVDYTSQEISQVLGIAGHGKDLVFVSWIGHKRTNALVGINVAGDDAEPKLAVRESLKHPLNRPKWVSAGCAFGQDQDVGFGSIWIGEVRISVARVAVYGACRNIHCSVGDRRQLVLPRNLRQQN